MRSTHQQAILKYDDLRKEARSIAQENLPKHLAPIKLDGISSKALVSARLWDELNGRKVDWDWSFSSQYCSRYPKAFDLSVWHGNTLLSLTLGRPTFKGTSMRMDFIERQPSQTLFAGDLFSVSLLAYITYARIIGAEYIRIINPMNEKLINFYKIAREKAKETSKELFKPKPKDVEEELKKETILGSPENLITPDNKSE